MSFLLNFQKSEKTDKSKRKLEAPKLEEVSVPAASPKVKMAASPRAAVKTASKARRPRKGPVKSVKSGKQEGEPVAGPSFQVTNDVLAKMQSPTGKRKRRSKCDPDFVYGPIATPSDNNTPHSLQSVTSSPAENSKGKPTRKTKNDKEGDGKTGYKKYTPSELEKAIHGIRTGELTVSQASEKFGVPTRTLYERIRALGKAAAAAGKNNSPTPSNGQKNPNDGVSTLSAEQNSQVDDSMNREVQHNGDGSAVDLPSRDDSIFEPLVVIEEEEEGPLQMDAN